MMPGSARAQVFTLSLSAPASTAAAASASDLIPPPTASGMNSSRTTAPIVSASARRASSVAVMSRITSSSMPSALYRRASSAGSPADRSPSKFTPFTTRPSRTSRQAMMRFESKKVPQDSQSNFAGLFRVKLNAGYPVALHDGGKRYAVLGDGNGGVGDGRRVAVREVHLR